MPLQAIAPDLHEIRGETTFLRQRVPLRSVIARLRDGSLWVYSPIAPAPGLLAQVSALGPVRWLVAPSRYHHLFVSPWREAFPSARLYGAQGLETKRRDLRFDALLDGGPRPEWPELDSLVFRGLPVFREVEFLHRPSRTLIVCDLVFHIVDARGVAWLTFRLDDMVGRFGPSRMLRMMMRWNGALAREDLERMLDWDFDRIVMAHGEIVESGGKDALRRAFAFLLGARGA
jgi:hypothetical protein